MLVEKLIGSKSYDTFTDLKTNANRGHFTHRITIDYTDYAAFDSALVGNVYPELAVGATTTFGGVVTSYPNSGLLKGWMVRNAVCEVVTPFTGIANQTAVIFEFGGEAGGEGDYPNEHDNLIKKLRVHGSTLDGVVLSDGGFWGNSDVEYGSKSGGGYIPYGGGGGANVRLTAGLEATVSSGAEKLDNLTAGKLRVYLDIVDMNKLATGWQTVTL